MTDFQAFLLIAFVVLSGIAVIKYIKSRLYGARNRSSFPSKSVAYTDKYTTKNPAQYIAIKGNPDLKTCSTDVLIAELHNRSHCCVVGVITLNPTHIPNLYEYRVVLDYSGDPFQAHGLSARLNRGMTRNVRYIPYQNPDIYGDDEDDDDEHLDPVKKE